MPRPTDAKWLKPGDVVEHHRDRWKTVARTDTHYPVNGPPFTVVYFTDGTDQTYGAHDTLYARRTRNA